MRSRVSDASMPLADSVVQGASPGRPSTPGSPAACNNLMHAQQPTEDGHRAPRQPPAALDGMEVAAGQPTGAPPDAQPAAAPAGSGGAAAIGAPADAGLLLDDVDIAEQRRILQDIAVRHQGRFRDRLLPFAVWGWHVWS